MQVAFKSSSTVQRSGARSSTRRSVLRVVAQAGPVSRRDLLSVALVAGAAPLVLGAQPASAAPLPVTQMPVEQLGLLQKQAQLKEFRTRAEAAIKEVVTTEDGPLCVRLVLNDAADWDPVTKTGGVNGSIVTPEALARPENAGLEVVVAKLAKAKAKIDAAGAEDGAGPISWADLIVLAAKVTTQSGWSATKVSRAQIASGGEVIAGPAFSAAWPVRLGRVDSPAAAAVKVPTYDSPVAEIKAFAATLGAKPGASSGFLAAKPPIWERPAFVLWTAGAANPAVEEARWVSEDPATFKSVKEMYDRSRRTVTRTDYEVDFVDYFTLLTSFATFKPDAYLHPEAVTAIRF
ncbi:hypothetical protein CHLRE_05g233900v5 [Chlamydomonas reinhardtii]|uniref:Plant heme peroxidase family profile domain-containing protein n=1 Tax=Chlamydomonas reinhardtii TaxID=3055 RepID=A8JG56_CHLRE|nr:uncharacterized protein CHLRE_05g233900v5 [Chlamydomonas reinhardtii]PNW83243.1 hypothetical protein CHLRE_05g233900v5 [Chlamydomonas reinhardtii]|eukprot:XP_001702189.1 L-ascorbate peroxidase [Chlamydomonas reinhardtii]